MSFLERGTGRSVHLKVKKHESPRPRNFLTEVIGDCLYVNSFVVVDWKNTHEFSSVYKNMTTIVSNLPNDIDVQERGERFQIPLLIVTIINTITIIVW